MYLHKWQPPPPPLNCQVYLLNLPQQPQDVCSSVITRAAKQSSNKLKIFYCCSQDETSKNSRWNYLKFIQNLKEFPVECLHTLLQYNIWMQTHIGCTGNKFRHIFQNKLWGVIGDFLWINFSTPLLIVCTDDSADRVRAHQGLKSAGHIIMSAAWDAQNKSAHFTDL